MAQRMFVKIIAWMIDNNVFTNLPVDCVLKSMSSDERQSFTAFMSSNLLLKQDMPEGVAGVADVLNFTYEQIRDYLITRYLVDEVFPRDKDRFTKLIEKYTIANNNQAEGTIMFLFLYTRVHDKTEVYEELKKQPWHSRALISYIWNIPDEKITAEEVEAVKTYLRTHADNTVKILVYSHWSPVKYKHLNIQVLFDVLGKMIPDERIDYLEKLWPSTTYNRRSVYDEPMVTPRGELLGAIKEGIASRKEKVDKERVALEQFEKYLKEGSEKNKIYIPRPKAKSPSSSILLYSYDSYCYLMRVHKGEKTDFLAMAGVENGYAKEMFSSIYDAIFAESVDVEEMYRMYYANEYKTFEQFLSMRYSIPSTMVKKFAKVKDEADYRLIEFDALSYGGDAVAGLVMSDELIERMYNWLNWQEDEDKD